MEAQVENASTPTETRSARGTLIEFWTNVLVGILASASLFGLIQAGIAGVIYGPLLASFVVVPVCVSLEVVGWALGLSRHRIVLAILGGGLTGTISTVWAAEIALSLPYNLSVVLAAILGGTGAGIAAHLFLRNTDVECHLAANPTGTLPSNTIWLRLVGLGAVIAFWAAVLAVAQYPAQQRIERRDRWIANVIADLKAGRSSVHLYSCVNSDVLLGKIAGMPEVHEITFEQTLDLSDEGLKRLPTFPNLVRVEFRYEGALNDQNIAVLSKCQGVESVEIRSSSVTDAGLEVLAEMPQLKRFQHAGQFSEAALAELQQGLPDCTIERVD